MTKLAMVGLSMLLVLPGCRKEPAEAPPSVEPTRPAVAAQAPPAEAAAPEPAAEPARVEPAADVPSDASEAVLCAAPGKAEPRWYDRAVGYEVFVRSFRDSDGDGVGDFRGLVERLDWLNDGDPAREGDLPVDLLWLMPVHQSPSYHGYDVVDYRAIDDEYGGREGLDAFLAAARARGIRVVADLVLNHSSSMHPWFAASAKGARSDKRDWYVWSDGPKDWSRPWGGGPVWHKAPTGYYYGLFWGGMPDLNYATPAVRAEMLDVARLWLEAGFDGYRLDAARYLVETGGGDGQSDTAPTHAFWRELHREAAAKKPDVLLLGEVWTDNAIVKDYFGTPEEPELDMLFDFGTAQSLVDAIRTADGAVAADALCERLRGYPAHGSAGHFLTNHDQDRLATRLAAAGPEGLKLAAALLLTLPGTPWIYYGQEIGMRNGPPIGGDEPKRLPMQWAPGEGAGFTSGTPWMAPRDTAMERTVTGQNRDPRSLLNLYRRLVRLRSAHDALAIGDTAVLAADGTSGTPLVVKRERDGKSVVLVFHFGAETSTITVDGAGLPPATGLTDALRRITYERAGPTAPLVLEDVEPRGFRVLVPDA